jgi:aminobenzoyl-glutamate transport protein
VKRIASHIALLLVLAQLLLMLVSWICSAAMPSSGIRSLLSSEGIRWFFGHFASMLATPVLSWILLLAAAYGCMRRSGLTGGNVDTSDMEHNAGNRRKALLALSGFLVVYVAIVLLMAIAPHAVLLSASGTLWPSPFSASLVPVIAFGMLSSAVIYGVVYGSMSTVNDIYNAIVYGLRIAAPVLLFYILTVQFYKSLLFVLP